MEKRSLLSRCPSYIDLQVICRYSGKILTKLEFSRQIVEKYSNIKFHENPSFGSRVVLCGRTDRITDKREEANGHF